MLFKFEPMKVQFDISYRMALGKDVTQHSATKMLVFSVALIASKGW